MLKNNYNYLDTGLENCTEGQILYDGKELKKMNLDTYRNTDIGIVFQSYNLLPRLTALENIILSMDISKVKVEDKGENYEKSRIYNWKICTIS